MSNTITFLSDFGLSGGYVAACELVMARLAPSARILHLDHEIAPGDVRAGARLLARLAPVGPVAVHLAVVDPGVGSGRLALALHAKRGDFLVGPDNGLLLAAAQELGGVSAAWSLDAERVRRQAELGESPFDSRTFDGRDLFSPAAALLTGGLPGSLLGEPVDFAELASTEADRVEWVNERLATEVVEIDRFGNVALAAPFPDLEERGLLQTGNLEIRTAGGLGGCHTARRVGSFHELLGGELGVLSDSWGRVALVMNAEAADEFLDVEEGVFITLDRGAQKPPPLPEDEEVHRNQGFPQEWE